jgi:protein AbiQ
LDYSKAVLLAKDDYVSNVPFQIPNDEIKLLRDGEHIIAKQFSKYVERYIKYAKQGPNASVLQREYRFSTLVNYHVELGI